jgi:NADH-quinone oxidoreductase subunit H
MLAPNLDVGVVYIFALSSIAVYGVLLGGWASNSKYSFLGGLRSSAQMVAYELPLGLGLLGVVLATGSLRLNDIIHYQAENGWWFAFAQPLGFLVFVVAAFAEAGRLPFDLPEAEQELVGGYHTEYAGMKLVLFLTAEFIHMITASFLIVILFLGGWHLWGLTPNRESITWFGALLRIAILLGKIFCVIFFFMMIRWSWPRFRFDQLMSLAWKVMLPLGLTNLVAMAILHELLEPAMLGGWFHDQFGSLIPLLVGTVGWAVAILAVGAAAWISPQIGDNTPRSATRSPLTTRQR